MSSEKAAGEGAHLPLAACIALCAMGPLSGLAQSALPPILPQITAHFAAEPDAGVLVRLMVSGLSAAMIVGAFASGFLAERIGELRAQRSRWHRCARRPRGAKTRRSETRAPAHQRCICNVQDADAYSRGSNRRSGRHARVRHLIQSVTVTIVTRRFSGAARLRVLSGSLEPLPTALKRSAAMPSCCVR